MTRLKESINHEEIGGLDGPTSYPTLENKYEFRCGECNELYYIDILTYERFRTAIEENPKDNPFLCEECEAEYIAEENLST